MKRKILLILSLVLLCLSCYDVSGHIELSRTRLDFSANGGQEHISTTGIWGIQNGSERIDGEFPNSTEKITGNHRDPYIYLEDKWVSAVIETATGDMIVTVMPNESAIERVYKIRFSCADRFATLYIYQKGKP